MVEIWGQMLIGWVRDCSYNRLGIGGDGLGGPIQCHLGYHEDFEFAHRASGFGVYSCCLRVSDRAVFE